MKNKKIKAWAVIGSDKKLARVTDEYGVRSKHYGVYADGAIFSKRILKQYRSKVVPCEITFKVK